MYYKYDNVTRKYIIQFVGEYTTSINIPIIICTIHIRKYSVFQNPAKLYLNNKFTNFVVNYVKHCFALTYYM